MVRRLFFIGLFTCTICPLQAQGWENYYDSALQHWNSDRETTAALLREANQLAAVDAVLPDNVRLILRYDLGITYWKQGDVANAAFHFEQSRKIKPITDYDAHQPRAAALFLALSGLAKVYAQQGITCEAKALYTSALFHDHVPVKPTPYYTAAQDFIALYENANALDAALTFWNRLTALHPIAEHNSAALYITWHLTGIRLNRKLQQYALAENKLSALKEFMRQQHNDTLSTSPYVDLLIEEGLLCLETGKRAAAKKHFRKAKQVLGKTRYTEEKLYRLAVLFELKEKNKKALRYNQKLARKINLTEPCSTTYLATQTKIADLYLATRKYVRAVNQYEYLLTAYRPFISEHDPRFVHVLNNLAESYSGSGDYHSAYVYLRWAHEVMDVTTIKSDLEAKILTNLATLYTWKGDHLAAKRYREQAALLEQ